MTENDTKKVKFDQIKSPAFRTVHADGVWGGITPRGYINMGFYSERSPFPRQVTHSLDEEGHRIIGEVKEERVGRDALLRELECNVIIDLAFAQSLIAWLQDKIDSLEKGMHGED